MNDSLAPTVLARKEDKAVADMTQRLQAMMPPPAPQPAAAPAAPQPAPAASGKASVGGVVRDVAQGMIETATLNPQRSALTYAVAASVDEFFDTALDLALYPFGGSHKDVDAVLDPMFGTFQIEGPKSTTGGVISGVTQFLGGMLAAGKALKATGAAAKLGTTGTAVVAGGLSEALVFDEQQARLSTLIESVPALRNPVSEYLAGAPDDSIVELKFKQALEGLALGGVTEGLFQGVRALKKSATERAAARAETPEGQAQAAAQQAQSATPEAVAPELTDRDWLLLGGKPEQPLFEVTPQSRERTASLIKMAEEKWGPDSIPGLLAEVRKPPPAPQGLMSWLRSKGGLKESGGELGARGLVKRLPGLVNNKAGMALDDAALAATEAGYIGTPGAGRASIDDLLAALDRENAGTPVWSSADQAIVDRRATVEQFGRQLDEMGIDISRPDAEIEAALRGRATGGAPQSGIRLYHGSASEFEAFDPSKMGSGAGSQTFGRGAYLTDGRALAETYGGPEGFVYSVDLAASSDEILDITAPLSAQSGEVSSALRSVADAVDPERVDSYLHARLDNPKTSGKVFYDELVGALKKDGVSQEQAADEAAKILSDNGIVGLKYKAIENGSSSNYVIFDANKIKISGKGGNASAEAAQAIDNATADNPDMATTPRTADDIAAENAAGALELGPDDLPGRIKIGDKVGNINLNRIAGTEDLKAVIRQTAQAIDAQTPLATVRQSTDIAREMADRLLVDPEAMRAMLSGQSVRGQAFTREEIIATGELVTQTGASIEKLAKRVAAGKATDAEKLALHRAVAFQGSVLNLVSGQAREAGRALQAFQTIVRGNSAAMIALRDATAQHGNTEALAAALNSLPPQGKAAMAKAAAQGGGLFTRGLEAVVEYWKAGLLWGPRTHMVNMTSNALTQFGGVAERYVAGRIGNGVAREEAAAMLYGQMSGFRDALRAAGHGWRTGQPLLDAGSKIETHGAKMTAKNLGLDENTVIGRAIDALGEVQRMSFRALTAEDEFFKTLARHSELHAQAYRTAAAEGLEGPKMAARVADLVANPTPEIRAAMNDYAKYVTFQQDAGPITAKISQLTQTHPLMQVPLPFIRTPTNIFKYAGERTPLALMSKKVRDEVSAGGARRDLALAKIALGSMAMATAADLATQGTIVGASPNDPQLRQALQRTGVLPYSVKVGDQWVQYNRLDPLGMTLGLAADFSQIMRAWSEYEGLALPDVDLQAVRAALVEKGVPAEQIEEDIGRLEQETGLDPAKVAAAVVAAVQENVLNKSYLQGLSDIFEILSAPSVAQSAEGAKRYLNNLGSGLMPVSGLVRQAESVVDPNLRYAETLMEAWRAMTPGMSSTLPAIPDLWGQPREHINSSLIPIAVREAKLSPVDSEIVRLKAEISMPERNIGGVRLKPEEYAHFVELAGRDIRDARTGLNARQYLDAVVSDRPDARGELDERSREVPMGLPDVAVAARLYRDGTDGPQGSKATVIKSVVSAYRAAARGEMMKLDPGLAAVIEARKRIEAERKAGAR